MKKKNKDEVTKKSIFIVFITTKSCQNQFTHLGTHIENGTKSIYQIVTLF